MEETPILNAHNKQECPPAHTAEHILNQTMVRMFGCTRSRVNHIERKKSKCNYDVCPCLGAHVERTSEIGSFRISSTSYNDGSFRIVFRVTET